MKSQGNKQNKKINLQLKKGLLSNMSDFLNPAKCKKCLSKKQGSQVAIAVRSLRLWLHGNIPVRLCEFFAKAINGDEAGM